MKTPCPICGQNHATACDTNPNPMNNPPTIGNGEAKAMTFEECAALLGYSHEKSPDGYSGMKYGWNSRQYEIDSLKASYNHQMNAMEASLSASEKACESMRDALNFYGTQWLQGSDDRVEPNEELYEDMGEKAREALATLPPKGKHQ